MPENLAREIAEAISEMSEAKWTTATGGEKWTIEADQLEPIIAAKLAEANTARDKRNAQVRSALIATRQALARRLTTEPCVGLAERAINRIIALLGGGE